VGAVPPPLALPTTSAESVTEVVSPSEVVLVDGCVVIETLHSPSTPRAKSKSVAVSDWEDRVSPMNTLKQWPPRPDWVRLRPPSKNSEVRRLWPTPSTLFEVSQGVLIVPPLTVAHVT